MTDFQISETPPQSKPVSLAEQINAIKVMRCINLRRIYPNACDAPEIARTEAALDAAANTLSQLTDW